MAFATTGNRDEEPGVVQQFLTSWGFPELCETFKDADISLDHFLTLDMMLLNMVLPNHTVGFKLSLLSKIREIKEVQVLLVDNDGLPPSAQLNASTNVLLKSTGTSCNGTDGSSIGSQNAEGLGPSNELGTPEQSGSRTRLDSNSSGEVFTPANESAGDTSSAFSESDDQPLIKIVHAKDSDKDQIPLKEAFQKEQVVVDINAKRQVDTSRFSKEKLAQLNFQEQLKNLDLKTLLDSTLEGKAVLHCYEQNNILEDDERNLMVDSLSKWVILRNLSPKPNDYIVLREKILQLFPNETNVYYSAPKEEGDHQSLARGKLFDRVRNVKDWMRRKGLLERKKGMKKTQSEDAEDVDDAPDGLFSAEDSQLTNDVKSALDWLNMRRDPWDKVEAKWKKTSRYRLAHLLASRRVDKDAKKKPERIINYVQDYKVLSLKKGYTLIEIDFVTLKGDDKADALVSAYAQFRQDILSLLKRKVVKDSNGKETVKCVRDLHGKEIVSKILKCAKDAKTYEESLNILVFMALPSLLPPSRLVSYGSKKRMKPSINDCRDSLINTVENSAQVVNFAEDKRNAVSKQFGANAYVQPYILLAGDILDPEHLSYYLCIDRFSYVLPTFLQAVDVCFKSFYALDLAYPVQADHIWVMIQQHLYEIHETYDPSFLAVKSFVQELKIRRKN